MSSKTISVRLNPDTLEKLGHMANAMHRPRAWLMSHAIERYVEHEAWQIEAIQEAVDALESGQARFASHEEVQSWLESWGTENEGEPPACR